MEIKEPGDKDSYGSLSKRELQDLCKKYGLPPCDNKNQLVNSLNSYFEKRNLSSISLPEGSSAQSTSLLPPAHCGLRDIADGQKDNFVANRGKIDELLRRKVFEGSNKEPHNQIIGIRRSSRLNKETEIPTTKNVSQVEQQPTKNALVPTKNISDSDPYFEVHAVSEGGLNLIVDLNCTSHEYYTQMQKQMKKQVLVDMKLAKEKNFRIREKVLSFRRNCNQANKSLDQTNNEENVFHQISSYTESHGDDTAAVTEEYENKNPATGTEVSDSPHGQDNLATPVRPKRKTADVEIANNSTSGNQHEKRVILRSGKLIGKSDLRRSVRLFHK